MTRYNEIIRGYINSYDGIIEFQLNFIDLNNK